MNNTNYTVFFKSSIREGLYKIDLNRLGLVFVIDEDERVIGVASDGDIRSCLLKDSDLEQSISKATNKNFVWKKDTDNRESILKLLDSDIKAIPILDKNLKLVEVITSKNFPLVLEKGIFSKSKAPVRVSFSGGGSDLTHYFMNYKGAVINATISLYCHSTLKPRSDKKIKIDSFDLDTIFEAESLDEFVHIYGESNFFSSLLSVIKPDFGFDLFVKCDFPNGSGLGGSSAVMSSILGCFNEFRLDKWDEYELSELAFQAERIFMEISGGWQDQYATVFGGFNFIEFKKDNNLIHPLRLPNKTIKDLQESLVLIGVDSGRNSGHIHDDQEASMKNSVIQQKVDENVKHSYDMRENLLRGKLREFGLGLNTAWKLKRQFSSKISNKDLDAVYAYALENGALGGKLLGAGGGGFFLFYIEEFSRNKFLSAMKSKGLFETIFQFDFDGLDSWTKRLDDLDN